MSVIVSVFNKAEFLAACLDSLVRQTLRNIEIICVDDASTDGSADILTNYAALDDRIQVIRSPVNKGPGPTRNLGIACASAPFVQFTDADDLLPKQAIERLHRRAMVDDVPIVRGSMAGFHTGEPQRRELLNETGDRSSFAPLTERALWIPWWHPCYLISKELLVDNGISYPHLRSGEDPVFLASVLSAAPRISTIADVTYEYRIGELEKKQRASLAGLRAFLHHARLVKQIQSRACPESWTNGYGPLLRQDIGGQIERFALTDDERASLRAEADALFADSAETNLRILFVYRVFGLGGVETSLLNKLEALRRCGVVAEAMFLQLWGDGGALLGQRSGVHVVPDRPSQVRILRRTWDAIVLVDTPEFADVLDEAAIQCPVALETHASYLPALRRYHSRVADTVFAAVITPSEFNRQLLLSAGCPAEKIHVVPNAIDPVVFADREDAKRSWRGLIPADLPLILSIGRLEPQKNTLEFIRIACALLDEGQAAHFVVVGDAVDTAEYAATVRAAVAPEHRHRFTFLPTVAYDAMRRLYLDVARSGGCLVVTSLNESQPMTILEAMATGCPVVATSVGGITELVFDSVNGRLYNPGDLPAALAAVHVLLTQRKQRQQIVARASAFVKLGHSSNRTAELYMAIVKKLKSSSKVVEAARPLPAPSAPKPADASISTEREFAARLDALVGQFVSLHTDILRNRIGTGERAVAALFSQPLLAAVDAPIKAYADLVPGVQIGFEPGADVHLSVRPKQDFSRSPDYCLNTVTLRYSGTSRWFTVEVQLDWSEFQNCQRYQIGLYCTTERVAPGHIVLRLPRKGGAIDHRLADFRLAADERCCHRSGGLNLPSLVDADPQRRPKLIFFFDSSSELTLQLDYLTAYFA